LTARATAEACSNVALIKYWGKRDLALNLPARGSLSVTLGGLKTRTTVAFSPDFTADTLEVDDQPGQLSDITRSLAEGGINITTVYGTAFGKTSRILVAVENTDKALKLIEEDLARIKGDSA